jgi:hypothetical protein
MKLAIIGTRPHPGGGSGRHRRPEAEEAEARGKLPPPNNKLAKSAMFFRATLFLFKLSVENVF